MGHPLDSHYFRRFPWGISVVDSEKLSLADPVDDQQDGCRLNCHRGRESGTVLGKGVQTCVPFLAWQMGHVGTPDPPLEERQA